MTPVQRHYLIASSTRADWGLLSPLARSLRERGNRISVAATNMHLLPRYGNTVHEIEQDGFRPMKVHAAGTPAEICAAVMKGFADLFAAENFSAVIVLGDRYEMVSVAQAAVLAGIPVVHIAGGAVSYGAFDDCFRHAITKMAVLHLVETEEYRRRVIQMGENPAHVVNTGAIGVSLPDESLLMTKDELDESLGFELHPDTLLITLHPATLSTMPPLQQLDQLFKALKSFPDRPLLFTSPNNDSDGETMIHAIETYVRLSGDNVHFVSSLGHRRYLSALRYVAAVVGNSSSGLVEVPSAGIPTLDIGCRQEGRTAGPSVVHCGETAEEIVRGLKTVLSREMEKVAARRENPYHQRDTVIKMCRAIENCNFTPYPKKRFNDIR